MLVRIIFFGVVASLIVWRGCLGHGGSTLCAFVGDPSLHQQLAREAATSQDAAEHGRSKDADLLNDPSSYSEVLEDNKTIRCHENKDYCYTLWDVDPADKVKVTILKQGCWDHPDPKTCSATSCVSRSPLYSRPSLNNTRFCCCTGDMCNVNVTDGYHPGLDLTPSPVVTPDYRIVPDPKYRERTIIVALVSVFSVAVIIVFAYLIIRLWWGSRSQQLELEQLIEAPLTPMFDLEQLKLCSVLVRGRYGDVWRGTLGEHDVAVKLFAPHQKQYFINETDIYSLPHMDHASLLRFLGAEDSMNLDGMVQYSIIVMTYIQLGTLASYLKENVIDWGTLCKMSFSAASGLAHLHTDIIRGDQIKPAIAHRDFNSRNILVRHDLTCCICDFGFAMKIVGSKFIRNGQEENAEQSSISDVGTLRYMAPEVLEGAVNLRDCEASLKQIDVYALGLVLWEIASRCSDLLQGLPVPDYKLPFEAELGAHPTFEEMQLLVSRNKQRPQFHDVWKDSNQAIRALKETIDDCWDQDAEARLTSLCVEERILEMVTLWDARCKVGVTPTNPSLMIASITDQGIVRNQTSQHILHTNLAPGTQDVTERNLPNGILTNSDHIINISDPPGISPNRLLRLENSVSASTVETTLTTSPSDPLPHIDPPSTKSNCNIEFAKSNAMLQPHQGQNPTVERNTHKRSDDKLVVLGNTLVDKSIAEEAHSHTDRSRVAVNTNSSLTDDLFEAIADNLESSLVQNDLLSQQRYSTSSVGNSQGSSGQLPMSHSTSNPSEPLIARPKQPNVPGNGTHQHNYTRPQTHSEQPQKHKSKFRFKRPKGELFGGKMSELYLLGRNLFKSSRHGNNIDDSANYYPTENLRNPTPGAIKPPGHHRSRSDGGSNVSKSNLEPRQVTTEVCLMNGSAIVRPTSLPLNGNEASLGYNVDQVSTTDSTQEKELCETSSQPPPQAAERDGITNQGGHENRLGVAEVGIAKLESGSSADGQLAMMRVKLKSQSSIDLSPTNNVLIDFDDDSKPRRPNSLSISGHSYKKGYRLSGLNNTGSADTALNQNEAQQGVGKPLLQNEKSSQNQGSDLGHMVASEVMKRQVNSPVSIKNGRFSLYDDRVMSQSASDVNSGKQKRDKFLGKSSISLTQFGSVGMDLNKFQAADFPC